MGVPLYHISSCCVKYFRELPRESRKTKREWDRVGKGVGDLAGLWSRASARKGMRGSTSNQRSEALSLQSSFPQSAGAEMQMLRGVSKASKMPPKPC